MGPSDRTVYFLIAVSFLFLGACGSSKKTSSPSSSARSTDDQTHLTMQSLQLESYSDEGLEWQLNSPVAKNYTTKHVMKAVNMDITIFKNGAKSSTINADQGILSTANAGDGPTSFNGSGLLEPGDMYLSGAVVVVSTDGSKLETEWAHYHKKNEIITSTAPVKVYKDNSLTEGVGLEATSNLSSVKIFNQTVTIKEKDARKK